MFYSTLSRSTLFCTPVSAQALAAKALASRILSSVFCPHVLRSDWAAELTALVLLGRAQTFPGPFSSAERKLLSLSFTSLSVLRSGRSSSKSDALFLLVQLCSLLSDIPSALQDLASTVLESSPAICTGVSLGCSAVETFGDVSTNMLFISSDRLQGSGESSDLTLASSRSLIQQLYTICWWESTEMNRKRTKTTTKTRPQPLYAPRLSQVLTASTLNRQTNAGTLTGDKSHGDEIQGDACHLSPTLTAVPWVCVLGVETRIHEVNAFVGSSTALRWRLSPRDGWEHKIKDRP